MVAALLMPGTGVHAMTGEQAFADGNRLFRDDLYWAALLRYGQAADAGLDSPLLHYNTGVAHYRAGQHIRAREALLRAERSPQLRVIARFNLGLNAYAAGDTNDALNWFRQARDQEENARIRRLAIEAIARLRLQERAADTLAVRVEKRQEKRRFTNVELEARVGFGNDDNVYRTPDQNYVDFANPALPLVTPVPVAGAFMPVDVNIRYWLNSLPFESFYWGYRLSGRYYQDEEIENANEFSHELRFGNRFEQERDGRRRRLHSAFTIAQHDETYYDPDDGTERTADGELIDDRMNYIRYGPQITFRQSRERLSFGFHFKGQLWDYERTDVVPEYDHEYFDVGGNVQYRFTSTSLIRLHLDRYVRRYSDRPSYDLEGRQLINNPALRYDYTEAAVTARQRITRSMWFGVDYRFTDRADDYLGYNNYTRDHYGFEYQWRLAERVSFGFDAYYRVYNYANAYAFNNPAAGVKTLETVRGRVKADFRMTRRLSLTAEADFREITSTDTRIAHERLLYSIGVTWQQ